MTAYHHIIGNNVPSIARDTCIYLDGVRDFSSLYNISLCASCLFSMFDFEIKQVVFRETIDSPVRNRGMKWLNALAIEQIDRQITGISSIDFFPSKRKTIDETWCPEIYLGFAIGYPTNSVFFSINMSIPLDKSRNIFDELSQVANACAVYIFEFPTIFSSTAYYTGISVDPADRSAGKYSDDKAERLSVWRDNTLMSLFTGKKSYHVCDGYVRDVYPIMILSDAVLNRKIDGVTIRDYLVSQNLANIDESGPRSIIHIMDHNLSKVQNIFDEHHISLSGVRL